MKNSNKWLVVALLVLLTSLTAYNMALRTEYRRGTYKDPLRDYTALHFSNFTEVDAPASSIVGIRIEAGPYRVRINPEAAKYVRLTQQGPRLVITAAFPDERRALGHGEAVVISCPRLLRVSADAVYQVQGKTQRDKRENYDLTFRPAQALTVQGFSQDSLALALNNQTRIELANNKLGLLRAVAGRSPGSHAVLHLEGSNQVAAADLNIGHQSELKIDNVAIAQLHWHFSDSAKATLTGRALGSVAR